LDHEALESAATILLSVENRKSARSPLQRIRVSWGADVAVLSGGEVIEREGKRKHWRRLEEGITDEGMVVVDEVGEEEGEALPEGDVIMKDEDGEEDD
jgi:hypothetical protein